MIEKFTNDGSRVHVAPRNDGIGHRLAALVCGGNTSGEEPAMLDPEEAAELGLALLRWSADAVRGNAEPALHVAVESSLDRASRLLGTALTRDGA